MSRYFVTGGAGFIGSNLVDRLLADGHRVTVYDNFSTGRMQFLAGAANQAGFDLVRGDILDRAALQTAIENHDVVVHLAANADVRFGPSHPETDLQQNTLGTFNVLEAARRANVSTFAFASTGSVYGEPGVFPTPECCPFPIQTSLYGASKLAGEGLLQAYAAAFPMRCLIFRFVSILGQRYQHGHVLDFVRQLQRHPQHIHVLGDGQQRKSYLDVKDCIDAILLAIRKCTNRLTVLNLGNDHYCTVNQSLDWICDELSVHPQRTYAGGTRGWVGDSPFIFLDTGRIRALGWKAEKTIRESVLETVRYLGDTPWLVKDESPRSAGTLDSDRP